MPVTLARSFAFGAKTPWAPEGTVATAVASGLTVTLTTTTPLPDGSYTISVDGTVQDTQAHAVGPASVPVAVCGAAAGTRPVITEVAWMGSNASTSDEWIEIFNPGTSTLCNLSLFTLVGAGSGSAAVNLPAVPLDPNEFFIVQKAATATGQTLDAEHSSVDANISLTNGGEKLALCLASDPNNASTCDTVNPGGALWLAGDSAQNARKTMERTAANNDPLVAASWQNGNPSSPLAASFAVQTPASLVTTQATNASTVVLTFSESIDGTTVIAAAFTLHPSGAVASAQSSSAAITLTTTAPLANGEYTVDIAATVKDARGLSVGPTTGAFAVNVAPPADTLPVITEVAWMGSNASANDEWLEIHNPGSGPICDLSRFVLVGAGASSGNIALPAVALGAHDFFVVQKTSTATGGTIDVSRSLLASTMNLRNDGEVLRLCPVASTGDPATCDVANPTGSAWFRGSNSAGNKKSMERIAADNDGGVNASWQNGNPSSPLNSSFATTPGDTSSCP